MSETLFTVLVAAVALERVRLGLPARLRPADRPLERVLPEHRDLEQARLAIEALRALVPVLSESIPPELTRDFEQVIANLQLSYAAAVDTGP